MRRLDVDCSDVIDQLQEKSTRSEMTPAAAAGFGHLPLHVVPDPRPISAPRPRVDERAKERNRSRAGIRVDPAYVARPLCEGGLTFGRNVRDRSLDIVNERRLGAPGSHSFDVKSSPWVPRNSTSWSASLATSTDRGYFLC